MSEYEYYEFAAIDRPLTAEQIRQLRALSTRATITPTRFANTYTWGSFKGDPLTLMKQYFDMFVCVSNWGIHELMLRLPRRLLSQAVAAPYCLAQTAILEPMLAEATRPGANALKVEYSSGYEDVVAVRSWSGIGIARMRSDSLEAAGLRHECDRLARSAETVATCPRRRT